MIKIKFQNESVIEVKRMKDNMFKYNMKKISNFRIHYINI